MSAADHAAEPTIAAWRVLLRFLGIIIALGVFSHWYAAGKNTGWTKDRIAETQVDEITGIEYVTYKDHFLPGVEILAGGVAFGLLLSAATFIRLKPKSNTTR